VRLIKFNACFNVVMSTDQSGIIEVWDPETHELPSDGFLKFETISETDYFELCQQQTFALAAEFTHDGARMAILCRDRKIRIFDFASGKLIKTYNSETLEQIRAMQVNDSYTTLRLEQLDFDKRISVEQEIEKFWDLSNKVPEEINIQSCTYAAYMPTLAFDESDTYLCFGTPVGLKVLNTRTNTLSRLLGKLESTERFLQLAIYQGKPVK